MLPPLACLGPGSGGPQAGAPTHLSSAWGLPPEPMDTGSVGGAPSGEAGLCRPPLCDLGQVPLPGNLVFIETYNGGGGGRPLVSVRFVRTVCVRSLQRPT